MSSFFEFLNSSPGDYITLILCIGFLSCMFMDLIISFINYLDESSWRVSILEDIIARNLKICDACSSEEQTIIAECIENYEHYLDRKEKRRNFFNKIKSFFKFNNGK